MKIRLGFVSNSSSSSFVLTVPKGTSMDQMRQILSDRLGISGDCFIQDLKKNILDAFVNGLDKRKLTEELEEAIEWKEGEEAIRAIQDVIDKKMDSYYGSFYDDGDPAEIMLHYSLFDIQEKDFILVKDEAGY